MAVKIIHAADFHMDSPFASLPEEKAARRRAEQRTLLSGIASLAEAEGAQLVLLAGDLFDSGASFWETQETLLAVLSGIRAEVFIAPGNHDYYSPKSPYSFLHFPENVHIFRTPQVKCAELPQLGCRVWGAGFTSTLCDPVLRGFCTGGGDAVDLMVLHGDMAGDRYNRITEEEIAGSGLDYLALGHLHAFSGIRKAGGTFYAYPGCPEGRGFDETGPKGVIAGTVDKGKCDLRFVPLPGRQYAEIGVDLTGKSDAAAAAAEAVGEGRPRDVARVVLRGEYSGVADTEAVAAALADKFYHVAVKDETIPARGLWDGADEDSLTGIFLSRMKERYDAAASDEERSRAALAARYGVAALEGREVWRP